MPPIKKAVGVVALLYSALSATAYEPPPSWDPMVMLAVTLDSSNRIHIESYPVAIPLTIAPGVFNRTNRFYDVPHISFDPALPFSVLNGTAYSRVLGWYDPGTTGANGDDFYDTYSARLKGNLLWIEKTGGSPEVKTYFINEDVTGDPGTPYTPILGTEGTSTRWCWDGRMDHNAYAVDLTSITTSNQLFTATYHLYIGDSAGNPAPAFGDATTTWRWQGPPVPVIPPITIEYTKSRVTLSWPHTCTNLIPACAKSPTDGNWITVTNMPVLLGGRVSVDLTPEPGQQFFRLSHPR